MANRMLGETLRELRKQNGYTQQQVADMLGLKNKSTLGSWEVGKSEPDAYTFLKLCKLYEVVDIYRAFGEIPPTPFPSEEQNEILEKYRSLHLSFQKIADNLIIQLSDVQQAEKR